ncbi:MAG: hypothetical protein JST21_18420 [Bacteroidetes bacterium]|nr:hypothetical protein [Bacteroidota bacterium]
MKLPILLCYTLLLTISSNCRNSIHAENNNVPDSPVEKSSSVVADTTVKTRFGVMVAKSEGHIIPPAQQVKVARSLGVNYIRCKIDISSWSGSSDAYDTYAAAGFKVLLNIISGVPRNAAGDHAPVPFPTDMNAYAKSLNSILDKYRPEVVVIENEEDNPNYHSGDADDYINELKTAIQVAHSKGLKVTNAGITFREVCLIAYDDMIQQGKKQQAIEFAQKVFPPNVLKRINNLSMPAVKRQLDFGRKIIAAYKTLDLDYVNFHWYEPIRARGINGADVSDTTVDPKIFEFITNFLKTKTGKPILSNEIGVFNPSPSLVKGLLQTVKDAGLSYAIFYSADGGVGKAVGLQNGLGELRPNGQAFENFIKAQQ